MDPLIPLPELARARIRTGEARAVAEFASVRRSWEFDLASAQRTWGPQGQFRSYVDLEQARQKMLEAESVCAQHVFDAHAVEYRAALTNETDLAATLAQLREEVVSQYGPHTTAGVLASEAHQREEASRSRRAASDAAPNEVPIPAYRQLHFNKAQLDFMAEAEATLDSSLFAREQLRYLGTPQTPEEPGGLSMSEDFRTLTRDINQYGLKIMRTVAAAAMEMGDSNQMAECLRDCIRDLERRILDKLVPSDVPRFDVVSFESKLNDEARRHTEALRKAAPPPWLRAAEAEPASAVAPGGRSLAGDRGVVDGATTLLAKTPIRMSPVNNDAAFRVISRDDVSGSAPPPFRSDGEEAATPDAGSLTLAGRALDTSAESVGASYKSPRPTALKGPQPPVLEVFRDIATSSGVACDPTFWARFNLEKTSRKSPLRDALIHTVVNRGVPQGTTDREALELIARESGIPVESVSPDLDQPVDSRGRSYSGFLGDVIDQIARGRPSTEWWLSDNGLNIMPSETTEHIPTFDELISSEEVEAPATKPRTRRPVRTDPVVQRIKKRVREYWKAGFSHSEICGRLGTSERPPRASWRHLPWPQAYLKHTRAVTKWLSEACSALHS